MINEIPTKSACEKTAVDDRTVIEPSVTCNLQKSIYSDLSSPTKTASTDSEAFSRGSSVFLEEKSDLIIKLKEIIRLAIAKCQAYHYGNKSKVFSEKKSVWVTKIPFSGQTPPQVQEPPFFPEEMYLPNLSQMIENCSTSREFCHVLGFFYSEILSAPVIKSPALTLLTGPYSFISFFLEAAFEKFPPILETENRLLEETMKNALDDPRYKRQIVIILTGSSHHETVFEKTMRESLVRSFKYFQDYSIFPIQQYREERKKKIAEDYEVVTDNFEML